MEANAVVLDSKIISRNHSIEEIRERYDFNKAYSFLEIRID